MVTQSRELEGRTAVVTGAGAGIGSAIADALAAAGATVIVNDIDAAAAESTVARLVARGSDATAVVADLGTADGPLDIVDTAIAHTGRLDVLVNNAGVALGIVPLHDVSDDAMERIWRVNLRGLMQCCRAAVDHMKPAGGGRIVNIGSRTWLGAPGHTPYSASKGGIVSFTRTLAFEVGAHHITANVVAPGSIVTPAFESLDPEQRATIQSRHPAGHFGHADDIGRAVRFLVHPGSGMITGQVLHVCGGRSLHGGPWEPRAAHLADADRDH